MSGGIILAIVVIVLLIILLRFFERKLHKNEEANSSCLAWMFYVLAIITTASVLLALVFSLEVYIESLFILILIYLGLIIYSGISCIFYSCEILITRIYLLIILLIVSKTIVYIIKLLVG